MKTVNVITDDNSEQILNKNQVAALVKRSLPWVTRAIKAGLLPQPIKEAGVAGFWTLSMINNHLKQLSNNAAQNQKAA